MNMAALLVSLLCFLSVAVHPSAVRSDWTATTIEEPTGATVDSISVSSEVVFTVKEGRLSYCQLPTGCSDGTWMDLETSNDFDLNQIDTGYEVIFGRDSDGQIRRRTIQSDTDLGGWHGGPDGCVGEFCMSEVSVSNDGTYAWVVSTTNNVYMCTSQECIGQNFTWISIDNETRLAHIEVGDKEVWGVNASNHIFKRPVNGSGEWRSVPGEMRYISASGYRYVWGIAPNDSLYNCEMPCDDGEWQYIGDNFKLVEALRNEVFAVQTNNAIVSFSEVNGPNQITSPGDDPTTYTEGTPATAGEENTDNTEPSLTVAARASDSTLPIALSVSAVVNVIVFVVAVVIVIAVVVVKKRQRKYNGSKGYKVSFRAEDGGSSNIIDTSIQLDGINQSGVVNATYDNNMLDTEYEYITETEAPVVAKKEVKPATEGYDDVVVGTKTGSSFRNRQYSIPNEYSLSCTTSQNPRTVTATYTPPSQPIRIPQSSEATAAAAAGSYGVSISTDGYEVQSEDEDRGEYEYSDEDEYWEPASMEDELKRQLESILKIPVISQDDLEIHEKLGCGQFGVVYRGELRLSDDEDPLEVAVKTLEDGRDEEERVKFLQEAAIMGQFIRHPNILTILGVVFNNSTMIVTEIMHKGDLHRHLATLRPNPDEPVSTKLGPILLSYSRQVANGLMYLTIKKYVHRDIAARNILVSADGTCKIADFGLSRDLCEESYYISRGGKIPVKWTAPEALNYRKYSTASDVWSFGCLLYEIWALGIKPFCDLTNKEVIEKVGSGYRLPPPPGCPRAVYKIMIRCWHPKPASRIPGCELSMQLSRPDFQMLEWDPKDVSVSDKASVLGAPLQEAHSLYEELQRKYIRNGTK